MQQLPPPLAPLARYRQFVNYTVRPSQTRPGKMDKVTINPYSGRDINAHDPSNWVDFDTAASTGHPVGFVLTPMDPFWFVDIDGALQPDGQWSPVTVELCQLLAGAGVEVSSSGTGLHIIGSGPVPEHGCTCKEYGLEFYHQYRFIALTGTHAIGDVTAQPDITTVANRYFKPREQAEQAEWTTEPVQDWSGPSDDDELLRRAMRSRSAASAFGRRRATFKELFTADAEALGECFPDDSRDFDHSGADAALVQHLAFWTGKNTERMDRLFRRSALMRDKWDSKRGSSTYGIDTILVGSGQCTQVYKGKGDKPKPEDAAPVMDAEAGEIREGFQFLDVDRQREFFKGCVYLMEQNRIMTPDGSLMRQEQFRVVYGGYTFALDTIGDRTGRNAWEAFTESQAVHFPKVHNVCFRPEIEPHAIVTEDNRELINCYMPVDTPKTEGDPSPIERHIRGMFPNGNDADILLAYMAAIVQYPGEKFQWAPVLQGTEGNGKSLVIRVLQEAVGRRYTHLPNPKELSQKYNGWIEGNLFIGVEEIHVRHKLEVLDTLKPMITNDRLPIRRMNTDEYTGDNRTNWVMCTNHRDAIPTTVDTRRYAIFYSVQQSAADIEKEGWGEHTGYFQNLYHWLKKQDGYAIVANWLSNYPIPDELNPATRVQRAPRTSSTDDAIEYTRGDVEQAVLEAVSQGQPGFCGGWISSIALDRLLERKNWGNKVKINKRREMLQSLGYDWHPGLHEGRVNNNLAVDNNQKPKLFIKKGHPVGNIKGPAEIARRYEQDQAAGPDEVAAQKFG